MKVILDELYAGEFFDNGGIVVLNDETVIDKTYAFYEFRANKDNLFKMKDCTIGLNHYTYNDEKQMFSFADYKRFLSPKDAYGIENVNFSLIDRDDYRWEEFKKQRLEQGFDESETWGLDMTIARFIYPRLKCFYNEGEIFSHPYGLTSEEWINIVGKMVQAFELIVTTDPVKWTEEQNNIVDEGLDLFRKYFFDLWN